MFDAEPCSLAEKHLQEDKKNKRQTELDGVLSVSLYLVSDPN
jgi:hypothetical protein